MLRLIIFFLFGGKALRLLIGYWMYSVSCECGNEWAAIWRANDRGWLIIRRRQLQAKATKEQKHQTVFSYNFSSSNSHQVKSCFSEPYFPFLSHSISCIICDGHYELDRRNECYREKITQKINDAMICSLWCWNLSHFWQFMTYACHLSQ